MRCYVRARKSSSKSSGKLCPARWHASAVSVSRVPSATTRPPLKSTKRSQTFDASAIWWMDRKNVRSGVRCLRSVAAASRLWRKSRPSKGSSIRSIGCGASSPSASRARLRCPLDSADRHTHQWRQSEIGDNLFVYLVTAAKKTETVFQHPAHRLIRPRNDAVWDVEQLGRTVSAVHELRAENDVSPIRGLQTGHAFEQRSLASPVRADQAKDLAGSDRESDALQCMKSSVGLG
jgi:hypothetical protein